MRKREIREAIFKTIGRDKPGPVCLRYKDEYFVIDKTGIAPADGKGEFEDYSQRCDSPEHFQHLMNHILARMTNDTENADYGFVWISEVKYNGEKCTEGGELTIFLDNSRR